MKESLLENIGRMAALKSTDMFRDTDAATLYNVLKISKYRVFFPNNIIVKKGDTGDSIFIFIEGKAGIYRKEKGQCAMTLDSGDIIGELDFLEKFKYAATVKAIQKSLFLEIKSDQFEKLLQKNGTIALSVAAVLTRQLRNVLKKVNNPDEGAVS